MFHMEPANGHRNPLLEEPPVDLGNSLLGRQNARLFFAPDGEGNLAVTIRTPSTTLTVFLDGPHARQWAKLFTEQAARISGSGLITG